MSKQEGNGAESVLIYNLFADESLFVDHIVYWCLDSSTTGQNVNDVHRRRRRRRRGLTEIF